MNTSNSGNIHSLKQLWKLAASGVARAMIPSLWRLRKLASFWSRPAHDFGQPATPEAASFWSRSFFRVSRRANLICTSKTSLAQRRISGSRQLRKLPVSGVGIFFVFLGIQGLRSCKNSRGAFRNSSGVSL